MGKIDSGSIYERIDWDQLQKRHGLTNRERRFVQGLIRTNGNQTAAYREAAKGRTQGKPKAPATYAKKGSMLAKKDNVHLAASDAWEQMQRAVGEDWSIDQHRVMADLEVLKRQSAHLGQMAPAVRAVELQGKQIGMFTDRVRVEAGVSDAELLEAVGPEGAAVLGRILEGEVRQNDGSGDALPPPESPGNGGAPES